MSEGDRLYHVLGLSRGASAEDVRRRYRDMAAIFHPDKRVRGSAGAAATSDAASDEDFLEVSLAHEVLTDSVSRAAYDAMGLEGLELLRRHPNLRRELSTGDGKVVPFRAHSSGRIASALREAASLGRALAEEKGNPHPLFVECSLDVEPLWRGVLDSLDPALTDSKKPSAGPLPLLRSMSLRQAMELRFAGGGALSVGAVCFSRGGLSYTGASLALSRSVRPNARVSLSLDGPVGAQAGRGGAAGGGPAASLSLERKVDARRTARLSLGFTDGAPRTGGGLSVGGGVTQDFGSGSSGSTSVRVGGRAPGASVSLSRAPPGSRLRLRAALQLPYVSVPAAKALSASARGSKAAQAAALRALRGPSVSVDARRTFGALGDRSLKVFGRSGLLFFESAEAGISLGRRVEEAHSIRTCDLRVALSAHAAQGLRLRLRLRRGAAVFDLPVKVAALLSPGAFAAAAAAALLTHRAADALLGLCGWRAAPLGGGGGGGAPRRRPRRSRSAWPAPSGSSG